jgi:hypothetical protein
LRGGAVVHHVNGIRGDNRTCNLVLCDNYAYHALLRRRTQALDECGHANWLRCGYCGRLDDPSRMYVRPGGRSAFHPECSRQYQQKKRVRDDAAGCSRVIAPSIESPATPLLAAAGGA